MDAAWAIGPALLAAALYLPALRYGLIWDDPTYYAFIAQAELREILLGSPAFQYYRPLSLLLFRSLFTSQGSLRLVLAHLLQLVWHSVSAGLAIPALVALGIDRKGARWAALLFAMYPFSFQAVAWQATSHPFAMFWTLLSLALAGHYQQRQRYASLALSAGAYGMALLSNEMSVPFLALYLWMVLRQQGSFPRRYIVWPWLHLTLALAYSAAWMLVQRKEGLASITLDSRVLAYLLQGACYPLARALGLLSWRVKPVAASLAFGGATGLGLAALAFLRKREAAIVGGLIFLAGILPVWVGLSWDYVRIGERLLYPASLGVAAWGGSLIAAASDRRTKWRWSVTALLLALSALPALEHIVVFHRLYTHGSFHLDQVNTAVLERHQEDLLIINAPDRLRLEPSPYPLGFWGLVLAPVVQDLGDYARVTFARPTAITHSVTSPALGATERAASPYLIDMRGNPLTAEELAVAVVEADAAYITSYHKDGRIILQWAGQASRALPEETAVVARWEGSLQLTAYTLGRRGNGLLTLTLRWQATNSLPPDETIFVHLLDAGGRYVDGADGDPLQGALPLHHWPTPLAVTDLRPLPWEAGLLEHHVVTIGVYNRTSGTRRAAWLPDGSRVPDDELALQPNLP